MLRRRVFQLLGVVAALGLSGCAGQSAQPTAAPPPIAAEPPSPPPSPGRFVAPSPSPAATATPLPVPTFTPTPVLPLRIAAELDPPTPRAGTEFALHLTVTNDGVRAANGVYIATSGPWDRWSVLDITPLEASLARDAMGWRILSAQTIPPHESRTISIQLRADAPSDDQLTFAVREAEPGEIR